MTLDQSPGAYSVRPEAGPGGPDPLPTPDTETSKRRGEVGHGAGRPDEGLLTSQALSAQSKWTPAAPEQTETLPALTGSAPDPAASPPLENCARF